MIHLIGPERFIANKAIDFDGWAQARLNGVTATEVARASTDAGFRDTVASYYNPEPPVDNPYVEFGKRYEGPISLMLKESFGIMPNEWLIASDNDPKHLATPDGLSLDHSVIAEIKTTGKDFDGKIPIGYRRQVQWQLYVTGADYCVFAWMLRVETRDGLMQPGWMEPKTIQIKPDDDEIETLKQTAERLWQAKAEALGR